MENKEGIKEYGVIKEGRQVYLFLTGDARYLRDVSLPDDGIIRVIYDTNLDLSYVGNMDRVLEDEGYYTKVVKVIEDKGYVLSEDLGKVFNQDNKFSAYVEEFEDEGVVGYDRLVVTIDGLLGNDFDCWEASIPYKEIRVLNTNAHLEDSGFIIAGEGNEEESNKVIKGMIDSRHISIEIQ